MPVKNVYLASNVLKTNPARKPHPAGVPFLNLLFQLQPGFFSARNQVFKSKNKLNLNGPGTYCICFRVALDDDPATSTWRPIYIGSFLGTKTDLFGGNVASMRWWKHLAGITMRGNSVSIANTAFSALKAAYPNAPLVRGLGKGVPGIFKPHGCVSSFNRVKFAIKHWNLFQPAPPPVVHGPSTLLQHFKFIYIRFGQAHALRPPPPAHPIIKNCITTAERALIDIFHPCCNTKKPPITNQGLYDGIVGDAKSQVDYHCDAASKAIFSAMQRIEHEFKGAFESEQASKDEAKCSSDAHNPVEASYHEQRVRLINTTTRLPADRALEAVLREIIDPDISKAIEDLTQCGQLRETCDQAIDIYLVNRLDDIEAKSLGGTIDDDIEDDDIERRRDYSEGGSEDMPDTEVLGRYFSHHLVFHKQVIEVCPEKIMQAARRLNEKMAKKLPIVDIYPALFCMVVIHEIGHALMDEDKSPAGHKELWSWIADLFDDGDTERFDSYLDDLTKPIGKCPECHRWPRAVPVELERMEHIIEESLANAIAVKQKYKRSQKEIICEFISRQSKPYRAGLKWQMDLTDLLKTAGAWGQFKRELLRGPATYDHSKDCSVSKCLVHRLIDDNSPPETKPLSTNSFKAEFAKHVADKI